MPLFRKLKIPRHEYAAVYGSRKVIKDPGNDRQQHFYDTDGDDLWTHYGRQIADLVPEGYILYAELVGFTPQGQPIQRNYTYQCAPGQAELYVYRVANINSRGILSDLSWDGVRDFCTVRGLKWVPELTRGITRFQDYTLDEFLETYLDERLADHGDWNEPPLTVSSHKTVDEGVCIRQEGLVPTILKAKSPVFLEHETKWLDAGELDTESAA